MGLPPVIHSKKYTNQVYIDMGPLTTQWEKDRFLDLRLFNKTGIFMGSAKSLQMAIGCASMPDNIKWKYLENGIVFEFTTIGGPPFRMYLQLAQMFPNYRFYTKCDGFSDCGYHGRNSYYFGEAANTTDCTRGVGHFGENCYRSDRTVGPFRPTP
jgi:hypothetical protein